MAKDSMLSPSDQRYTEDVYSHTLFQHGIRSSPHCKKARKRNKRYKLKRKKKRFLFADITVFVKKKNPKKLKKIKIKTKPTIVVIIEFSKVTGYKVNMYKSIIFLIQKCGN